MRAIDPGNPHLAIAISKQFLEARKRDIPPHNPEMGTDLGGTEWESES